MCKMPFEKRSGQNKHRMDFSQSSESGIITVCDVQNSGHHKTHVYYILQHIELQSVTLSLSCRCISSFSHVLLFH